MKLYCRSVIPECFSRGSRILLLFCFIINTFGFVPAQAQELGLPKPGTMVHLSPAYNPPTLRGLKVDPQNPMRFDFILDQGDSVIASEAKQSNQEQLKTEANRLIKYFLSAITVPEKDLWVNLSPYEKDRIIPDAFGKSEMGRDLLAQDYMLKQITASLIYPEDELGKEFWKRIYAKAAKDYGTTNIPINTFNKVWIMPDKAVVYEKEGIAYIEESSLKVMLEQDYLALDKNRNMSSPNANSVIPERFSRESSSQVHSVASSIVRELILPELTKEVNQGKNFAQLRQIYNSLILATWYKRKLKESLLAQVYADKNKVGGLSSHDADTMSSPKSFVGDPGKNDIENIYHQYLQAFKKGAFNYIKEEVALSSPNALVGDPGTVKIPRKYFSGGFNGLVSLVKGNGSGIKNSTKAMAVKVDISPAQIADPSPAMTSSKHIVFKGNLYPQIPSLLSVEKGELLIENVVPRGNFNDYWSQHEILFSKMIKSDHDNLLGVLVGEVIRNASERQSLGQQSAFKIWILKDAQGNDLLLVDVRQPRVGDQQWATLERNAHLSLGLLKDRRWRHALKLYENMGGGLDAFATLALKDIPVSIDFEKDGEGMITRLLVRLDKVEKLESKPRGRMIRRVSKEKLFTIAGLIEDRLRSGVWKRGWDILEENKTDWLNFYERHINEPWLGVLADRLEDVNNVALRAAYEHMAVNGYKDDRLVGSCIRWTADFNRITNELMKGLGVGEQEGKAEVLTLDSKLLSILPLMQGKEEMSQELKVLIEKTKQRHINFLNSLEQLPASRAQTADPVAVAKSAGNNAQSSESPTTYAQARFEGDEIVIEYFGSDKQGDKIIPVNEAISPYVLYLLQKLWMETKDLKRRESIVEKYYLVQTIAFLGRLKGYTGTTQTSPGRHKQLDAHLLGTYFADKELISVADVGVSDGSTTLDLLKAAKSMGKDVSIDASDVTLTVRAVKIGNQIAFFDTDGQAIAYADEGYPVRVHVDGSRNPKFVEMYEDPRFKDIYDQGNYFEFDRVHPAVKEYQEQHPNAPLTFQELDIAKEGLSFQKYDLVRVGNLIQHMEDHDQQQMMVHASNGVKDGGYLLIIEEGSYILWQRKGNDFNLIYCDDSLRFRFKPEDKLYPGISETGDFVQSTPAFTTPPTNSPTVDTKTADLAMSVGVNEQLEKTLLGVVDSQWREPVGHLELEDRIYDWKFSVDEKLIQVGSLFFMPIKEIVGDLKLTFSEKSLKRVGKTKAQVEEIAKERVLKMGEAYYQEHKDKIIFMSPISEESLSFPMNQYTGSMVGAMEYYAKDIKDKTFVDIGAGTGVLSLVALALGAKDVVLVESEDFNVELARGFLKANGYDEGTHYSVIKADLKDYKDIAAQIKGKGVPADQIVMGINIGPWSFYGEALQYAHALVKVLKPGMVLDGGFHVTHESHFMALSYTELMYKSLGSYEVRKYRPFMIPELIDSQPASLVVARLNARRILDPSAAIKPTNQAMVSKETRILLSLSQSVKVMTEKEAQTIAGGIIKEMNLQDSLWQSPTEDKTRFNSTSAYQRQDTFVKINGKAQLAFIRIGYLFMMDQEFYSSLTPERKEGLQRNIVLVKDLAKTQLNQMGFRYYNTPTIISMLNEADMIKGSLMVDMGAGDGILSVIALKLGAKKAILYDLDEEALGKAKEILGANGFDKDSFEILTRNITDVELLAKQLSRKAANLPIVVVSNIGNWDEYTVNNQPAIQLASRLSKVRAVILGGYTRKVSMYSNDDVQPDILLAKAGGFTQVRAVTIAQMPRIAAFAAASPAQIADPAVSANSISGFRIDSHGNIDVNGTTMGHIRIDRKGGIITDGIAIYCNYCLLYNKKRGIGILLHVEGGNGDKEANIEEGLKGVMMILGGADGFQAIIARPDGGDDAFLIQTYLQKALKTVGIPIEAIDVHHHWFSKDVAFDTKIGEFSSFEDSGHKRRSIQFGSSNGAPQKQGGIDLTQGDKALEVKNGSPTKAFGDDSGGIKFNIDPAMLAQLKNAQGFVPVIINVQPITDLRKFLGLSEIENSANKKGNVV